MKFAPIFGLLLGGFLVGCSSSGELNSGQEAKLKASLGSSPTLPGGHMKGVGEDKAKKLAATAPGAGTPGVPATTG